MSKITNALNKAKFDIIQRNDVFISTILFSMNIVEDEATEALATDGLNVYINPEFFLELDPAERIFGLCHEAWHVAFNHFERLEDRDHSTFNIAGDHVINLMLEADKHKLIDRVVCGMPFKVYADPKYRGWSTEEVYADLEKNPPPKMPNHMQDVKPPSADGGDQGGSGKQGIQEQQKQIKDIIIRAATEAKVKKQFGNLPAHLQFKIEKLINPKLPWYTILQNYFDSYDQSDYSMKRPNRRHLHYAYLPGMQTPSLGELAVAVDASASVTDKQFQMFVSEIESIRKRLNPSKTTILTFDTEVKAIDTLEASDDIRSIEFTGRGGTNLHPAIDYFRDNPPRVLVVFSDLYCTPVEVKTPFPVIWVCVDNPQGKVNFGKLIHYQSKEQR